MKVSGIRRISQITEHLYEIGEEISPEDIVKVMRLLAKKEKELQSGYYEHKKILYSNKDLSREEFSLLLEKAGDSSLNVYNILDGYFQREEIINKIRGLVKVRSSTTKASAIDRIANDKELLFSTFKEEIINSKSLNLKNFCEGKNLVPAVNEKDNLVFGSSSPSTEAISGRMEEQFWQLSWNNKEEKISGYNSRAYNTFLFFNLKDKDEKIIKMIREISPIDKELDLKLYTEEIEATDFRLSLPEEILYPVEIDKLGSYFGKRHASKFETFAAGLEEKADEKTVRKFLGKKFLLRSKKGNKLYLGMAIDKELFEKIAVNLSIQYLDETSIVCKLGEKKTREVISALWEICRKTSIWGSAEIGKAFYLVRLD